MVTSKRKGLCTTWLEKLASPYLQMQAQTSIKPPEINIFIREAKELFCLQVRSGRLFCWARNRRCPVCWIFVAASSSEGKK